MNNNHSFHIPVMGIGFTIDTPLKVAKYGIDSVISLVDDILLEKLRKMYSEKFEIPYKEITDKIEDFRAKRITSYLNLIGDLAERNFETLKNVSVEKSEDIKAYINMLPNGSSLKSEFKKITENGFNLSEIKNWANKNLTLGHIDVNIMTKVDKDNYIKNVKLPVEYNDAHAALRGFANSKLKSSVILSAGMNPRLYAYMSQFEDFYPNEAGHFNKKIILKVSDYRSAIIQGKFLAKKGLWVSEYRIESGLNCGGHAFATDGYLLGPVLQEFKEKREELRESIQEILNQELKNQGRIVSQNPLSLKISAQGGVGTDEEHEFLLEHYQLDSIGWGTPFLLVPEATTVDEKTLQQLVEAKEDDLYLSDISPLGVPFNNLKGNTKDLEKEAFIDKGRPGSSCPKKFVSLNKEFKETGICTASREYQYLKIKELDDKQLSPEAYQESLNKITEKTCTCVGLGTSTLLAYNLDTKVEGKGVSICPGPNMAYYSKIMSLKNMTDHIYGRDNMITRTDRPNMFIKELHIYIDFLKNKLEEVKKDMNKKEEKYLLTFTNNMKEGLLYYQELFTSINNAFEDIKEAVLNELEKSRITLQNIGLEIENLSPIPVVN
ncbi:MAG: hypothetical protein GW827_10715 [Flavobacteriales bacterium]|nr:hypothetical protein [Flavobacteriia bacterium]NCP06128.1 hypothetical protein [Flavobacteriales bacterium]PIV93378.1 MAG: hypothetical protein COW44_09810 [Flavobacteriaceae bacterium CG17_big_fil_post_rev_8_21_14_2_50_33_15]NCP90693.1 hypothetical protein [Flavobacteriales bacterium]NCQ15288.1 hypothetical protein [Flavobacteriales bacterium]